jgi:hypothetical protein
MTDNANNHKPGGKMIGDGSCRAEEWDCDLSEADELALTQFIMSTIERFSRDQGIKPCRSCLGDILLSVAAMLHLKHRENDATSVRDTFLRAARNSIEDVIEADTIFRRSKAL